MPIDVQKAMGAPLPESKSHWNKDQVILYHLGIGAGIPPTDPRELAYCYEPKLKVLPSFGVIPVFQFVGNVGLIPGMAFNPALLLHGEQDLEIHKPIPTEAEVTNTGRVSAIYDKGKGAVVVIEALTRDSAGDLLFTNRFSLFLRGEGGFGGESGPKPGNEPPAREADQIIESPTLPQQALLYRLSGDKNPLHADPNFAKMGGFDQPILHGLCFFGIVCKAIVDNVLDGDTTQVARYQVRFAGSVYPGETIVTSVWKEGNQIITEAKTKERGKPVITNAAVTLRR